MQTNLDSYSEYGKLMIQKFRDKIENRELQIITAELQDLVFINHFDINKLILINCENANLIGQSLTVKELHIFNCSYFNLNKFQLGNLEVFVYRSFENYEEDEQEDQNLIEQLIQFQKLKELNIKGKYISDLSYLDTTHQTMSKYMLTGQY
ncbi:Hypothetical_protein [Hexamita inflata]|uniref:Hypothetical_protein n=1 Tax=Hexamita inflata TaxID=28002 RepID=A0AA86TE05_9EUKA|nr:Hypothetical protein HINF_LOCUS2790 [Hexamita inflata]